MSWFPNPLCFCAESTQTRAGRSGLGRSHIGLRSPPCIQGAPSHWEPAIKKTCSQALLLSPSPPQPSSRCIPSRWVCWTLQSCPSLTAAQAAHQSSRQGGARQGGSGPQQSPTWSGNFTVNVDRNMALCLLQNPCNPFFLKIFCPHHYRSLKFQPPPSHSVVSHQGLASYSSPPSQRDFSANFGIHDLTFLPFHLLLAWFTIPFFPSLCSFVIDYSMKSFNLRTKGKFPLDL